LLQSGAFIEYFRLRPTMSCFEQAGIAAVDFESADPSVVKSIKQRDLLNTWLRLYARDQSLPRMDEYQPERMEDELPDLVFYTVDTSEQLPRLTIESDGTRMSSAYGHTGKGRYLEDYLGARLAPLVMPVYYECIARRLPVYTIANIDDIYGRIVAYERLLLPFSDCGNVTHLIASLKNHQRGRRLRDQESDAWKRQAAGAETSRHHRPRSFPPRTRPHSVGRPDRIRLGRWNSRVPIPRRSSQSSSRFAVGTRVTSRPPHRSVRAQFGHTAPTSGV
jgi:hypothetical protein